jgi:putative PIN family toxin of toxin-antitoxin system
VLQITADTNIFISGLNFAGNLRRILKLAEAGVVHLTVSDAILSEIQSDFRRQKFGWPEVEIERALKQISQFSEHVEPSQRIDVITEDPTDYRILECAIAGKSEHLVTGDNHLLKLKQFAGTSIISPADFLRFRPRLGSGFEIDAVHIDPRSMVTTHAAGLVK